MTSSLFLGLTVAMVIVAACNAKQWYDYKEDKNGASDGEVQAILETLLDQDPEATVSEIDCVRIAARLERVNQTRVPVGLFIITNQFLPLTNAFFDNVVRLLRFALASSIDVSSDDLMSLAQLLEKTLHEELLAICDLELTPTIGDSVFMIFDVFQELFEANASVTEEEEEKPMNKGFPINIGGTRRSRDNGDSFL